MEQSNYGFRSNNERSITLDIEEISPDTNNEGISDNLHLAALLGKTLLEKNGDLEIQLKRLEEFAEETLATNHALTNQLNGYKDALKLANSSCESLELKLEELDKENKELKLTLAKKEVTLEVKTKFIDDLHMRLDMLENEFVEYKEEMTKKLKVNKTCDNASFGKKRTTGDIEYTRQISELEDFVGELSFKLQNVTYQKNKLQQNLDRITSENTKLTELLDKNETENIELQSRIKFLEDGFLSQPITPSSSLPPQSPTRHYLSPGIPIQGHSGNEFTDEFATLKQMSDHHMSSPNGLTLFSELQTEFNILQTKFDSLLSSCQCDASAPYKEKPSQSVKIKLPTKTSLSSDTSLKDLFEEVYATLKQTTIVADKLIERRKVFQ